MSLAHLSQSERARLWRARRTNEAIGAYVAARLAGAPIPELRDLFAEVFRRGGLAALDAAARDAHRELAARQVHA